MTVNVDLRENNNVLNTEMSDEQNDFLTDMFDGQTVGNIPLDSPHFTGIPTAPTAQPGTMTTQLATTEFVEREIMLEHADYGNIVYMSVAEVTS